MWLSLGLLALLAAITYFHTIQGLFSALLSAVLTLLCAALAFATFEVVAAHLLAPLKPDFALGLALVGMFILPLFVLRLVLDKFVHRACLLPLVIDKPGGLVFGLLAAYVMVGMLALGIQLMPFGNGFLGFSRVDPADPSKEQEELLLKPDRAAVKLASVLSDGVLSGSKSFTHAHPDFVTEVGWIEGVIPLEDQKLDRRGVRRYAPPGSMRVTAAWEEPYVYSRQDGERSELPTEYHPRKAEGRNKFIRVQMNVEADAADADKVHRFTLFQARLVGDLGDRREQYHAMATVDADQPDKAVYEWKGRGGVGTLLSLLLKPDGNRIDVVFEVPEAFEPDFVEYKAGARERVVLTAAPGAKPDAVAHVGAGAPPGAGSEPGPPGGPARIAGVGATGSFFGEGFPEGITMTDYVSVDPEINHGKQALEAGHLHGVVANQGAERNQPPVSRFTVPPDKRLLHLSVQSLQAGSVLGKALSLAVTTMKNYLVTDDKGRPYRPVGAYIIADSGGTRYIEIQYFPESAELAGRAIGPWSKLNERQLRGDYTYVLLYLVEPGARLVRFTTGGGRVQPVDLGNMDLVAPQ